jgi:hypothetical protein
MLGSSKTYPDTMVPYQDRGYFNTSIAYFSEDPEVNPTMYHWNSVFIRYCDGASFAGARNSPIEHKGHSLYFRGSSVQDAAIALLVREKALTDATDVVIGGASAGGLSAFLHADRWLDLKLPRARVTAMPDSGFFLAVDAAAGDSREATSSHARVPSPTQANPSRMVSAPKLEPGQYASDMRALAKLANASGGLRLSQPACVAKLGDECFFAETAARFLRTPTFALQSVYDSWQTKNEMAPGAEANASAVDEYGARVSATLHAALLGSGRQNGAFIDACAHHCFKWGDIRIRGDVQATAFAAWYAGSARGRAAVWQQNDSYPCAACCSAKK